MRRILFTVLASCVVLAAVPAISTAHGGEHHRGRHHQRHHRREHARRHHRVRVRHFNGGDNGDNPGEQGTAGMVTSFTGGVLTITLNDGNTVSGEVTQRTELKCEMAEPEFQDDDQGPGGGDSGSGDNGGSGSGDNGGDGRGGPDPGDDQGDNDDQMCTTIAAGMTVEKAELRITSAGAFWEEVELIS